MDPTEKMDSTEKMNSTEKMDSTEKKKLNSGICQMLSTIRAAVPKMGLRKLTETVNSRLPEDMKLKKHEIKDFIRGFDEANSNGSGAAALQAKINNVDDPAPKPRDEAFNEAAGKVFVTFRGSERKYMLECIIDPEQSPSALVLQMPAHPIFSLRHHIEVYLTLKGLKPCTLFFASLTGGFPAQLLAGIVLECLIPALDQHFGDGGNNGIDNLEAYGFRLHYIAGQVQTHTPHGGFDGAWVLADTQNAKWPLVRDALFKTNEKRMIPEAIIGAAMGYPVKVFGNMHHSITFQDHTEQEAIEQEFAGAHPVDAMFFLCNCGNRAEWHRIKEYYEKCRDAVMEVGTDLQINMVGHIAMLKWYQAEALRGEESRGEASCH